MYGRIVASGSIIDIFTFILIQSINFTPKLDSYDLFLDDSIE